MRTSAVILKTLLVVHEFVSVVRGSSVIASDSNRRQGKFLNDFIRYNTVQRYMVGLQFIIPVAFFMPNFGTSGRQNRALSLSEYRRLAAVRQARASLANACPSQKVELEDYLYMLHIDVESCQKRFICELASDPTKFAPISEIFLKKIVFGAKYASDPSDEWYEAAHLGFSSRRQCHLVYGKCPVSADAMINMNYLWMWQMISRLASIRFAGESDNSIFDS